jgi:hypothetical protein
MNEGTVFSGDILQLSINGDSFLGKGRIKLLPFSELREIVLCRIRTLDRVYAAKLLKDVKLIGLFVGNDCIATGTIILFSEGNAKLYNMFGKLMYNTSMIEEFIYDSDLSRVNI